jgi:hypothetical protein
MSAASECLALLDEIERLTRTTQPGIDLRAKLAVLGTTDAREQVATMLCEYVAMRGTTMELESFMFRCAGMLRGDAR